MNCPSRPDQIDVDKHPGWNQSPHEMNSDATTRADLNGVVNQRARREHESSIHLDSKCTAPLVLGIQDNTRDGGPSTAANTCDGDRNKAVEFETEISTCTQTDGTAGARAPQPRPWHSKTLDVMFKYAKFVGPGFIISVAYIDPGNYATDVQAGAETRYRHLFIILLSNLIAIFLQSLCIRLGSVTGLNLAENCRKHLPRYVVYFLWIIAEAAIVATDVAEVLGTAISLNLLFHIPLVAGCAISLVDVFILLAFYNPEDGSIRRLRFFEYFVSALVLGVFICFCIQLTYIRHTSAREVFLGFVPSSAVIDGNGVYLSCGIIGATVMPHAIFLGSGIVQPRLKLFDEHYDASTPPAYTETQDLKDKYRPSIQAIRSCLTYSIVELVTALFTFALFVNSAILIVAGASLYGNNDAANADLFGIHALLDQTLGKVAGVIFALALLMSGTSAGIVCTMAGQMVSEGMLQWQTRPWVRRLVTRSISIIPSIVVAAAVGKKGVSEALNNSQIALSVALPFVSAPLIWFTCKSSIMTVTSDADGNRVDEGISVNMRNSWWVAVLGVLVWLLLVVLNVALIVLAGLGKDGLRTYGDDEDHDREPPWTTKRVLALVAQAFLWTGSQIPVYLLGGITPYIYSDIGGVDRWTWLVLAYLLTLASICPFVGSLSDLIGRRYVSLLGSVLLIVAMIIAGTAKDMDTFIAGMGISGVGAGICELNSLAVTSELAPTRKRGVYVAILVFTIVPFCPSVLYGIWAAIGFFGTLFFYFPPPRPNSRGLTKKEMIGEIDFVGGFLSISGLVLFLAGLQWGGYQYKWSSAHALVPLILGAFLVFVAFPIWEIKFAEFRMFPSRMK
ncbi:hypothetical protein AYO22_01249 [Fonsecaea multimorphosa]|nr:hypothetical protein AYO22_01249 [Fonsecaea multimorphosa]